MGEKTGGYFLIRGGHVRLQGAEITPWWQLVGIGSTVAIAVLAGLVLIHGLDRIVPLHVSEEQELKGLDPTYWNVPLVRTDRAAGNGGRAAVPAGTALDEPLH